MNRYEGSLLSMNFKIEFYCGAPDALSFEHFLPWISKIMLAYDVDCVPENDPLAPKEHSFSTGYYTKKVN